MSTAIGDPALIAHIGDRTVPVHLGDGALDGVGPLIAARGEGDGVLVVVDGGIRSAGDRVAASCAAAGLRGSVDVVPAGEAS